MNVGDKLYTAKNGIKEHIILKVGRKYYTLDNKDKVTISNLRYESDYGSYQTYRSKEEIVEEHKRRELFDCIRYDAIIVNKLRNLSSDKLQQIINIIDGNNT